MAFLQAEYRNGGQDRLVMLVRARGRGASALDYLVQDAAGRPLAGELAAEGPKGAGWSTINVANASEDGGRPERVTALTADFGRDLRVTVGDDLGRVAEIEEAIATAFVWTLGLAVLLGVAGGVLLSRTFLARIDAIAGTAEAIIAGDLSRRIPMRKTGDDLDRLSETLNHMLDRIADLMGSLRQVSSDVAHDLRTPLSRLHLRLEEARTHAATIADYEAAIEQASEEADALLETFAALLRIAQIEGQSPHAGFRRFDAGAMVEAVASAYVADAEDGGRSLKVRCMPGLVLEGDRELLTQALANIVENALRHTPLGTGIVITLVGRSDGGVDLSVADDGLGITAVDLPRVTHRFFRSDTSRSTPGAGLGLSLVAAVADLHAAKLRLTDAEPGLRVTLSFPPPPKDRATIPEPAGQRPRTLPHSLLPKENKHS